MLFLGEDIKKCQFCFSLAWWNGSWGWMICEWKVQRTLVKTLACNKNGLLTVLNTLYWHNSSVHAIKKKEKTKKTNYFLGGLMSPSPLYFTTPTPVPSLVSQWRSCYIYNVSFTVGHTVKHTYTCMYIIKCKRYVWYDREGKWQD